MALSIPTDQDVLQAFLKRRHPEYDCNLEHWNFLEETYKGGREWFYCNIHRNIKEGNEEFKKRLERAYRFNHSREVVDLVNKYIFKMPVNRNLDDASPAVKDFWKKSTRTGLNIDQYMRLVSAMSSTYGRIWVFTDTNKSKNVITLADEKQSNSRVYSYFVKPQNVLDIGHDDAGELNWILVREVVRNEKDPIRASGALEERFRLWTRDEWALFSYEVDPNDPGNGEVILRDQGSHNLGVVPAFPVDYRKSEEMYVSPSLLVDIAYLDKAVANYLSNLDAIIQDQTFSQLVMPAQNLLPGDETYDKLLEMGTKRIFLFDGEGGSMPAYISPDVKQVSVVVDVVNKIISEIYHTVGMAGERTKQDNAVGIDNSSGVAKAYDFERINSLLAEKAHTLSDAENMLIRMVDLWNGKATDEQADDLVEYADNFDVRGLYDEFEIAERLALVSAPESVRQEQMKIVVDKLFPAMSKALRQKMETDIEDNWPQDPAETAAAQAGAVEQAKLSVKTSASRQGQVVGQQSKTVG